ncbi:MAG: IS1595 family transposase, partial [Alphaproteobacteria bacterium]|nr:IS1595 family transposase [Alphaproteobacteria bacterium]
MGKNTFAAKHFHDEEAARQWFENTRWPSGPHCPSCGTLEPYKTKKAGVYRCKSKECRRDFTVMTGTVMERSHAKLTLWAAAFTMAAASKKGFSAHQLHRQLGCQYNTAWFMFHRVREAMRRGGFELPPMRGAGKIVEADETYYGKQERPRRAATKEGQRYKFDKHKPKRVVVALVERGGKVRSYHIPFASMEAVTEIVNRNLAKETRLMTDESRLYGRMKDNDLVASHETVKHSTGEYVRGDVHTNSVENYFLTFKRGMRGTYQHCGPQ